VTHRAKVGPEELFDLIGAQQFCVLVGQGLRAHHRLLDVGCGCLRGGRFFIPYLDSGNYCGVEPDKELVNEGIAVELGQFWMGQKAPVFWHFDDWELSRLADMGRKFGSPADFEYVLAQSILSHAGRDIAATLFDETYKVLVDGGQFVGTFFQGDADTDFMGWGGTVGYTDSTVARMALEVGFDSLELLDVEHPMGQTWFVARKA